MIDNWREEKCSYT